MKYRIVLATTALGAAVALLGSVEAAGYEVTPTCQEAAEWAHDALARRDPGFALEYRQMLLSAAGKQKPNVADGGCHALLQLCPDTLSEVIFAGRDGQQPSTKVLSEVMAQQLGRSRVCQ